jgi:hypothetical protein
MEGGELYEFFLSFNGKIVFSESRLLSCDFIFVLHVALDFSVAAQVASTKVIGWFWSSLLRLRSALWSSILPLCGRFGFSWAWSYSFPF